MWSYPARNLSMTCLPDMQSNLSQPDTTITWKFYNTTGFIQQPQLWWWLFGYSPCAIWIPPGRTNRPWAQRLTRDALNRGSYSVFVVENNFNIIDIYICKVVLSDGIICLDFCKALSVALQQIDKQFGLFVDLSCDRNWSSNSNKPKCDQGK